MCTTSFENVILFLCHCFRNAFLRNTQLQRTLNIALCQVLPIIAEMKHWLETASVWGEKADAVLQPAWYDNGFTHFQQKSLLIRDQTRFMKSQHYVSLAIPAFPHSKYKEPRSEGLCEAVLDKPRQSHILPDYCIHFLTESNARSSQILSW